MASEHLPIRSATDRREKSSSSEAEPLVPVLSARYRASWPDLRPLPLEESRSVIIPPTLRDCAVDLRIGTKEILTRRQLWDDDETDTELLMRQEPNDPETAIPTLVIVTPWSPCARAKWRGAVQEIAAFGAETVRNSGDTLTSLHVEMIAPELYFPVYYAPVRNEPVIFRSWDQTRAFVRQRLESFDATKGRMTAIALFRYGLSSTTENNPITIYISVDYTSNETQWEEVMADIKSAVGQRGGWEDVQVHIEHNIGMHSTFPLLPLRGTSKNIKSREIKSKMRINGDYQQTANLGDDVGSAHYITRSDNVQSSPGLGTLGCFVEIKTTNNPDWTRYALTNYHVTRSAFKGFVLRAVGDESRTGKPKDPSDLLQTDEEGYWPAKSVSPCNFESPSRTKHSYTMWSIDDEIELLTEEQKWDEELIKSRGDKEAEKRIADCETAKEALEDEKERKLDFFKRGDQILGELYCASGFKRRARDNHRLDWALIKLHNSRQWSNRLPSKDVWAKQYHRAARPRRLHGTALKEQSKTILLPNQGNPFKFTWNVWKVGTATGPTTGEFHQLKADVCLTDDKHIWKDDKDLLAGCSSEYLFQPTDTDTDMNTIFAAPGDSGSVVFDDEGGVVGLLCRGQRPNGSTDRGFACVTPIEHVFQDIKDFSKGQITGIRIAVD
ncbi:hypothetical protein FZEAL_3904 [Fusarium zealandicum]|uniref:Serine protease n=1 Tax=Fusarium zealandicum TaxID=1053134 RepID=A0A8H4UMU1_9HYPO|nr:hypothetical protein FZEAL_3904 [Fusarium zealandicum]